MFLISFIGLAFTRFKFDFLANPLKGYALVGVLDGDEVSTIGPSYVG